MKKRKENRREKKRKEGRGCGRNGQRESDSRCSSSDAPLHLRRYERIVVPSKPLKALAFLHAHAATVAARVDVELVADEHSDGGGGAVAGVLANVALLLRLELFLFGLVAPVLVHAESSLDLMKRRV